MEQGQLPARRVPLGVCESIDGDPVHHRQELVREIVHIFLWRRIL
jgi:hypothetical protein